MGIEIEREFIVKHEGWRPHIVSQLHISQGYIAHNATATVRIRIQNDHAYLTIKGASHSIYRSEFEYQIPMTDANELLKLCLWPVIRKTRYIVQQANNNWDVDVFAGDNAGLILAEIELDAIDAVFERPDWLGEEVSGDQRFYNVNLARQPFKIWRSE